jgi:hypothetical protein
MKRSIVTLGLLGAIAAVPLHAPLAQTQPASPTAPAPRPDGTTRQAPTPGANSFTEAQARSRIADAGFSDVSGLRQGEDGVWRGRATRSGMMTDVAVDFRGNVVSGPAAAAMAPGTRADRPATPAPTTR